jgi:hypothetical protein
MGFKKIDRNLSFADLALASSMDKNRSLSALLINALRGNVNVDHRGEEA